MLPASKFGKKALWMVAGNVYYAVCQWAILIIIARNGGTHEVGVFSLAYSVTTPIIMFFSFGLRTIVSSEVSKSKPDLDYVVFRVFYSIFGLFSCMTAAILYSAEERSVIIVVAIAKTIEMLCELSYGFSQKNMNFKKISISFILRGTISTSTLFFCFYLTKDLATSLIFYSISWAAVFLLYDIRALNFARKTTIASILETAKMLTAQGLPLGLTALLMHASPNIPRYALQNQGGSSELGLFSGLAYFITVGTIVMAAIGQSLVPILARFVANGDRNNFIKYTLLSTAFAFSVGLFSIIATYLFGEYILNMFYGPKFSVAHDYFPLFAVAATLSYMGNILGYVVNSMRIFTSQAVAFTFTLAVSLVGSFYIIPMYNFAGAIYTLIGISASTFLIPLILIFLNIDSIRGRNEN